MLMKFMKSVMEFFGWVIIKTYFKVDLVTLTSDGYIRFNGYAASGEESSQFLVALGKGFRPVGEFKNRQFFFFRSKEIPVRFHPFILAQNTGNHKSLWYWNTGSGYSWVDECISLYMEKKYNS